MLRFGKDETAFMLGFLCLLVAGFPSYGPPSNADALEAIMIHYDRSATMWRDPRSARNVRSYHSQPVAVFVERCERRANKKIPDGVNGALSKRGYECVIEIFPFADPPHRTSGFFYFEDGAWRYHGSVSNDDAVV